jgi:hypothetical protein
MTRIYTERERDRETLFDVYQKAPLVQEFRQAVLSENYAPAAPKKRAAVSALLQRRSNAVPSTSPLMLLQAGGEGGGGKKRRRLGEPPDADVEEVIRSGEYRILTAPQLRSAFLF